MRRYVFLFYVDRIKITFDRVYFEAVKSYSRWNRSEYLDNSN